MPRSGPLSVLLNISVNYLNDSTRNILIKSAWEAWLEGRQWLASDKILVSLPGPCLIGSFFKGNTTKLGKDSTDKGRMGKY